MSRNRRRSQSDIATSSEEEYPAAPSETNANRKTRLLSRYLSSPELDYGNDFDTTVDDGQPPQSSSTPQLGEASSFNLSYNIRSPSASGHFPHILVEASKEGDDPKVPEEDNPPVKYYITEPISELPNVTPTSELPYVEPKSELAYVTPEPIQDEDPPGFASSWAGSLRTSVSRVLSFASLRQKSGSSSEEERSHGKVSTSETDEYDREEKLITKTQKYYKKRPTLIPICDDSEESIPVISDGKKNSLPPQVSTRDSADTISGLSPAYLSDYPGEKVLESRQGTLSSSSTAISTKISDKSLQNLREGLVFIYMVIPPDGGYGWIIMVISFLCQLIVDGIIFSIGGILPAVEQEFKAHEVEMLLVASVQIGCYFLSGAFASILINRFAFRSVAISGSIIAMLTIVAGSFSPNLGLLVLFYGAIGGCSMSLMWGSSQLIVACYFERYRSVANGFACSGVGAGAVVFSVLNNMLVPIIGWRHMLRVQAGAILLVMLLAIAYIEVRPVRVGVMPENSPESSSEEYYGNFYVHDYLRVSPRYSNSSDSRLSFYDPEKDKRKCCPCWRRYAQRRQERREQQRRENDHNLIIRTSYIERDDLFYTGPAEYEKPHSKENLEGKEIHLVGTDKNAQQVNYGIQQINDKRLTGDSIEKKVPIKGQPRRKRCSEHKFVVMLSRLFDYHLFKQFEFQILVVSAFLYPMGFNIPFVLSKTRTTIPNDQAILITPAIGFSNFVFRIICGFVAFKRRHWTTNICGGGMVFGGFFVFVSAFYGQDLLWFQMIYGFCYGVAPAVYSTLRAIIYVKYLGLAKLTNAFGITALAMGIGVFTGTTVAGVLVGDRHNYSAAFIFAGLCLMASGMLKLMMPSIVKFHYRRQARKTMQKTARKTVRASRWEVPQ